MEGFLSCFEIERSALFDALPKDCWDRVNEHIAKFSHLGYDWDSNGSDGVRPEQISYAQFLAKMMQLNHVQTPDDIYPLPDGNVLFEWRLPDEVICRLEVEGDRVGELMTSYPDKPMLFQSFTW